MNKASPYPEATDEQVRAFETWLANVVAWPMLYSLVARIHADAARLTAARADIDRYTSYLCGVSGHWRACEQRTLMEQNHRRGDDPPVIPLT